MNLARLGNKYLTDTEPWKVAKTDMDRVASILGVSLEICANLAFAFAPFLPFSTKKLCSMLNIPEEKLTWDNFGTKLLEEGHTLGAAELLFGKIEDDQINAQLQSLLF